MENGKTPAEVREEGLKYTLKLCQKLIDYGVPGIHLYTMGKGTATNELLTHLFK
jgi:methylenetetrahydrofolate reductase (NADPH)